MGGAEREGERASERRREKRAERVRKKAATTDGRQGWHQCAMQDVVELSKGVEIETPKHIRQTLNSSSKGPRRSSASPSP